MTSTSAVAYPLGFRLLEALGRRSRGVLGFAAAEIMAARSGELRRLARLPRAFAVRPAEAPDMASLASLVAQGGDASKLERLRSSGDVCLVTAAADGVHAMEWVRPGPAAYHDDAARLGVVFQVPAGACWLHNGRGRGSELGPWAMILGSLPAYFDARGVGSAYLQVGSQNEYSIRCHESHGFRRVARVLCLRVGGLRLVALREKGAGWVRQRTSELDLGRLAP